MRGRYRPSLGCVHSVSSTADGSRNCRALSALGALHTLKLHMCLTLRDVRPLATLVGLRTLDLGGCDGVSDVLPLSRAGAVGVCQAAQSQSPSLRLLLQRAERHAGTVSARRPAHPSQVSSAASSSTACRRSLSGLVSLCTLILAHCWQLSDLRPSSGPVGRHTLDLSSCIVMRLGSERGRPCNFLTSMPNTVTLARAPGPSRHHIPLPPTPTKQHELEE
jgi:hypothetical protein